MSESPQEAQTKTDVDHLKESIADLHTELNREHNRATLWMVFFWATWMLIATVFAFRMLVKLSAHL